MDKLSELLANLKDRFSSPLIFSFIVSWLFINWRIPVALFWYNGQDAGVQLGLISYVSNILSANGSFAFPLGLAAIYTLINPILKNSISAFYAWNIGWGETWKLSVSKGSKVPIAKYLSLREKYIERTKALEEIITGESATQDMLSETELVLLTTRSENNKLSEELSRYRQNRDNLSNVDVIKGRWKRTVEVASGEYSENIEITGTTINVRSGMNFSHRYQINSFIYFTDSKTIRFMLTLVNERELPFYSFEELELRHDEMVGYEFKTGSRLPVRYDRY